MKKMIMLFLMGSLILSTEVQAQNARTVIDKMLTAIDNAHGVKFKMNSHERFGDKFIDKKCYFKIWASPLKIYMKDLDTGIELLYLDGWNNNKCYINPNGAPWINVSFSPLSSRVRKDQHHTLYEAGFSYIAKTMRATIKLAKDKGEKFEDHFSLMGETTFNGKQYYQLYLTNDKFAWIDYTLTQDETPRDIAQKLNLTESLIESKNGLDHDKIKAGKTIKIPNSYARKVVFYIDKTTFMPMVQFIYDDKGLYEKYEYYDFELNPTFNNDEFSEKNKEYKF